KYEMYKLDRLLAITCIFGTKLDEEENGEDAINTSLKRKREAMTSTPTTSNYFQDKTNSIPKKKK
ncbi:unnamed protein product, partial [Adineta steineri]